MALLRSHAKSHTDFIRRLQLGEHPAWEQFIAEWSPKLYNYMCYNLPTIADVSMVLEETMSAIVESIRHFDDSVSFTTFIYAIAARNVATFHRHHRTAAQFAILETTHRRPSQLPNTHTNTLTPTIDSNSETEASVAVQSHPASFFETLAQLPDQSRQAMLLRYRIGLSIDDIALVLGQSYNATCSLLRQGQKHFGYADISA